MKKMIFLLCFCFISSGLSAVESGNMEAKRDSLVAKLKNIASSDTSTSKTEKIEGQTSKKDSLIAKLKRMEYPDTNAFETEEIEGQDSKEDSFKVKSENISTSDSSFFVPKKKEWYDVKGSVFGETQGDTTLQDSGTYLEGKEAGAKAYSGNEMSVGFAAGALLGVCGYAYPFVFVSGEPSYEIRKSIENKGEEYKKGFLKGYRRKKKTNALSGVTGGCAASCIGLYIFELMSSRTH